MADPGTAAIGLKLSVEVISRVLPTGFAWMRTKAFGKRILIVGDRRVGKSSFAQFLHDGILEPERPTHVTTEPTDPVSFRIDIGDAKRLQLQVSGLSEEPGQWDDVLIAKRCSEIKPHLLVVMSDASRENHKEWVKSFLRQLQKVTIGRKTRLASMLFLVNKVDKVATFCSGESIEKDYRPIVIEFMSSIIPAKVAALPILPSVLVKTTRGQDLANQAVTALARELQ